MPDNGPQPGYMRSDTHAQLYGLSHASCGSTTGVRHAP
jgi:hypothetical protein